MLAGPGSVWVCAPMLAEPGPAWVYVSIRLSHMVEYPLQRFTIQPCSVGIPSFSSLFRVLLSGYVQGLAFPHRRLIDPLFYCLSQVRGFDADSFPIGMLIIADLLLALAIFLSFVGVQGTHF